MIRNDVSAAELADIIKDNRAVVIDFHATWCGPCKMFAPIFEKTAEKNGDRAEFIRIDVDKVPELAMRYSVKNIPTIVGIRNGEVIHFSSGIMTEPSMQELLDRLTE